VLQRALHKGEEGRSSAAVVPFDSEIIKQCLSDVRLQSLFSIQEKLAKTQDHLQKHYNQRIFIGLLESLINEMQNKLHPDLENSFSKIMELSLILSQIKNHM
jgi:cob(I)alamin adenosyltransferase